MRRWQITAGLWFWGSFTALGAVLLVGAMLFFLRNEVVLDLNGVRAHAVVERIVTGKFDVVHIRFVPRDGAPVVHTTVESLFGGTPQAGDQISIDFDPGHPTRAREAGDHDPLLLVPLIAASLYFVGRGIFGRGGSDGRRRRISRRDGY